MFKKLIDRLRSNLHSSAPVQQDIVGIDLAHDYIRTIQLTKNRNQWSLTKLSCKSVNWLGQDKETKDQEILRLLKNCRLEQKFDTLNAAVSLPVSSAIIQVIQIPYLAEDELNAAVENGSLWENTISVPGDFNEYSIFWQVIKRDLEKNQLSILFVASRIDEVEHYCDLVRKAGFEPLIVDVRCFALRNVIKTYGEDESSGLNVFFEISGEENYAVFVYDSLPFIYDIFVADNDVLALKKGGADLTAEVFNRIGSQIRASVASFIKQSGTAGIEKINVVSSLPNFELIYEGLKREVVEYQIVPLNPLDHIHIPAQLLSRVDSEKNLSSLGVAVGLATRRLDIFGYYKFITAVANINLLPNRKEMVEKEKVKIETGSKMVKLATYASVFMLLLLGVYFYLATTFPSSQEAEDLQLRKFAAENDFKSLKEDFDASKHLLDKIGKTNQKILNLSYLQELPSGVYVIDISQKRKMPSEITLKAVDASLVSTTMNNMSSIFKNVKLMAVETNRDDMYQLSKITYQVE